MQDIRFFHCAHCGNVAIKAYDAGVPMVCCGEEMGVLEAGTVDAALEKHVPVLVRDGETVTVTVGAVPHPMEEKHYITFIAALADGNLTVKQRRAGDAPQMVFKARGAVTAYEYCNLHGLWKGEE